MFCDLKNLNWSYVQICPRFPDFGMKSSFTCNGSPMLFFFCFYISSGYSEHSSKVSILISSIYYWVGLSQRIYHHREFCRYINNMQLIGMYDALHSQIVFYATYSLRLMLSIMFFRSFTFLHTYLVYCITQEAFIWVLHFADLLLLQQLVVKCWFL